MHSAPRYEKLVLESAARERRHRRRVRAHHSLRFRMRTQLQRARVVGASRGQQRQRSLLEDGGAQRRVSERRPGGVRGEAKPVGRSHVRKAQRREDLVALSRRLRVMLRWLACI